MKYLVLCFLLPLVINKMPGADPRSFFYDLSSYVEFNSSEQADILYELLSPGGKYRATVYFYKNQGGEYWSTLALFDGPRVNPPLDKKTIPLDNRIFAIERSTAFAVRWIDDKSIEVYLYSPFRGAIGRKMDQWKDVRVTFIELEPKPTGSARPGEDVR